MSLPAPYIEAYHVADGIATAFPFGTAFTAPSAANVKCIIYFADGTNCVPTFTVDVTTGYITIVTLTKPDGTVLTVPPAGSIVRVFRDTPEQQNVTASQLQNYTAKQLERIFDSVVAMIQETSYLARRKTIRLTETQRDVSVEQLTEEKDQGILYWDFETRQLKATDYGQDEVVKSETVDRLVYLQPEGKIYFIPKGTTTQIPVGAATIHNDLSGRNAPDCHPESAITGLTVHLQELRDSDTAIEHKAEEALSKASESVETANDAKDIAQDAKDIADSFDDRLTQAEQDASDAKDIAQDASDAVSAHITDTNNPHSVTASQVGLGNVDNTSDADKPISDATQSALDGLQDEIDDLKGLGRFLSVWNCATGLAETNPPTSPYTYNSGDYFLVGTVDSTTNYKPDGATYTTGVASTTVETDTVKVNDVYIYDGTTWKLQANVQRDVVFSAIQGDPYDNTALSNALNSKVDETSTANQVYGTDNNGDQTTYNITDFGAVDDVKVNNVSVVTSKIANIDLTNYVTLSTTQAITGTKTFKAEILSWNNITFESAQANPIIRGMSGASYRNMITRTNSASAIDVGNTSDTINFKGSGTRPTYNSNDLAMYSDVPSLTGYIQNTATGTDSLTVLGTATSATNALNVGTGAGASGNNAVAYGNYASAEGEGSIAIGSDSSTTYRARATHKGNIAIGHDAYAINDKNAIAIGESAHANGKNVIQLGTGNNTSNNTFQVASYQLLDTSTGLIPDARISTNIARTADIPTVNDATLTIQKNGTNVATFTANASSAVTANISVPTTAADIGAFGANDIVQNLNSFTTKPKMYFSTTDNVLFSANRRFTVAGSGFNSFNGAKLFDGSYEDYNQCQVSLGGTGTITITGSSITGVYRQGYMLISFYSGRGPANLSDVSVTIENANGNIATPELSWESTNKLVIRATVATLGTGNAISKITISVANNRTSGTVDVVEVEYFVSRPSSINLLPVVVKNANNVIYGSLTADSLIKSGGTSAQFLKADGSTDSNTYATTAQLPTVNNPTITITQGGVTKGSFTLNQASGDTIALDAGGGGGDIDCGTMS